MRSLSIPEYIRQCWEAIPNEELIKKTLAGYQQLRKSGTPLVSIVIPAYNEEKNIVQTLASLTNNQTDFPVEIIVVNNNSKDNTENLVLKCGVTCVNELKQGITAARNAGLQAANGTIVMNADADTIYPPSWIAYMATPLIKDTKNVMVYGSFSFIPTSNTARWVYFFYEYASQIARLRNKYFKDEAVNVYGFNSAFRKQEGLQVNGFEHPPGSNEDGWLALKLREQIPGTLYQVTNSAAYPWTTDRRLQMDGGLIKATITRIKRLIFKEQVHRNDL